MNTTQSTPYTVVVGIDYSATSDLALEEAFRIASSHERAEVHAVNVVILTGQLAEVRIDDKNQNMSLPDASKKLREYVQVGLANFEVSHGKGGIERAVGHIRVEFPPAQIAQLAVDLDADMIVVGSHGRRGLRRLLLGSVAEGVVRQAPCPVLVVRPKGDPNELPVPQIEPPCPQCIETRKASGGSEFWCERHRENHGQRHTYHYESRGTDSNMPLVKRM